MSYPNTWREDRVVRRAGGFQAHPEPKARPGRRARTTTRTTRLPPLRGGFKETAYLGRYLKYGARIGTKFIPGVGLVLIALEVGWYLYQRSTNSERTITLDYDMPGWNGPIGCSGASPKPWQHQGTGFCIGPFAFTHDTEPWGTPVDPAQNNLHLMDNPSGAHSVKRWTRDGHPNNQPQIPGTFPIPHYVPVSPIQPWNPADPMNIPMEPSPQVHPDPMPVSPSGKIPIRRDWRSPSDGSSDGPPDTGRRPRRLKKPKQYQRPADVTTITPGQPKVAKAPGNHDRVPPKPGVKEKKIKAKTGAAFRIMRRIIEELVETVDYLEAFYNALPADIRKLTPRVNARDPVGMYNAVYKNFDTLVVSDVLINLLLNEIEDWVYGRLGAASKYVAQELNLSVGPQFGQGYLRDQARIATEYVKTNFEVTK